MIIYRCFRYKIIFVHIYIHMISMRGGEILSNTDQRTKKMVDLRYFSYTSDLDENINTERSYYQQIPVKNIESNVHEWDIQASSSGYRDLQNSYIVIRQQLVDSDGNKVSDTNKAVLKPLHSLLQYRNFRTYLNNVDVSDQNDGGLYPFTAFHRVCLTEEAPGSYGAISFTDKGIIDTTAGGSGFDSSAVQVTGNTADARLLYEDLCDIGITDLTSNYKNSALMSTRSQYREYMGVSGDTVVRPKDGIWQQDRYIPPDTQIRIQGELNTNKALINRDNTVTPLKDFDVDILSCNLYLRIVFPNDATRMNLMELAKEQARYFPVIRARTTYFNIPSGSVSAVKSGLLAGSRPSVLAVQFVTENTFNSSNYDDHLYNGGMVSATAGSIDKIPIKNLYCQVGNQRYPPEYQYGREKGELAQDANSYLEYTRLCQTMSGDAAIKPFLSPLSKAYNIYFLNTRQNGEDMYGNKVNDATSLDSINLNVTFGAALAQASVCIVTALSNGQVTMSPSGAVATV
eukprot:m.339132 g.339132  ORF g.339132 m.339132 type:complete len:515 (+) comp16091_c0_seq9:408-1952(+)